MFRDIVLFSASMSLECLINGDTWSFVNKVYLVSTPSRKRAWYSLRGGQERREANAFEGHEGATKGKPQLESATSLSATGG